MIGTPSAERIQPFFSGSHWMYAQSPRCCSNSTSLVSALFRVSRIVNCSPSPSRISRFGSRMTKRLVFWNSARCAAVRSPDDPQISIATMSKARTPDMVCVRWARPRAQRQTQPSQKQICSVRLPIAFTIHRLDAMSQSELVHPISS